MQPASNSTVEQPTISLDVCVSACGPLRTESRAEANTSLNVITAGSTSYTRPDGVNVIALGHLTWRTPLGVDRS